MYDAARSEAMHIHESTASHCRTLSYKKECSVDKLSEGPERDPYEAWLPLTLLPVSYMLLTY